MPSPPAFKTKERYDLVKKYLGDPPCEKCIVKAMCFKIEKSLHDGYYEIHLNNPCDEAYIWFRYGDQLGHWIDLLIKENNKILDLGPEKIKETLRNAAKSINPSMDPYAFFGDKKKN
jgi:hypothetical protein